MSPEHFTIAIDRVRAASARRRSSQWASAPERVLGLPLRPITPATFDWLHGTGNAFVCGLPPTTADVANFLFYQSPAFDPDAPGMGFLRRFRLRLRIAHAICPLAAPPHRRAALRARNVLRAIHEIRAIISDTWADALPAGEERGPLVAACPHAQLADLFAREYHHWPLLLPLRHTPLAQLFQLARCTDRARAGTAATYFDPAEAAIIAEFLRQANAAPAPVADS